MAESSISPWAFLNRVLSRDGSTAVVAIILLAFFIYVFQTALQRMNDIHEQILENGKQSLQALHDINTKLDAQTRLMFRHDDVSLK